jgi:hypothetical protein
MRELLIRYLLGELEPDEHDEVQRRLAESPELCKELAQLRSCFAASCHEETAAEPPRGLAERVTERVASFDGDEGSLESRPATAIAGATEPPAGALGWSLADLTVAGGVMLAVSMLLFPALRESRDGTRRNVCANNQCQLWFIASDFARTHGYFPPVEPHENAGIFAVKLVEFDYISKDDLAVLLTCPGAPLADDIRSKEYKIRIPTSAQLKSMSRSELAEANRHMSPMIAYRFGYFVGPRYHYVRNERHPHSALFADAPGDAEEGEISPNHGGSIVQVIDSGGNLRVLTSCTLPGVEDDLFHNALGMVAAGVGQQDSVLGRSEAVPGTLPFSPNR